MRLIDGEKLEKEGWRLIRSVPRGDKIWHQTKGWKEVETVHQTCEPLRQGDIVLNTNNYTYGVVISLLNDKKAAQILEISAKEKQLFINCPPLAALEKTGKHLTISRLILNEIGSDLND